MVKLNSSRISLIFTFRYSLFVILCSLFVIFSNQALAQESEITGPTETPPPVPGIFIPNPHTGDRTIYPGGDTIEISARVGEFVVNIEGLSAPHASVVLSDANGTFLRSGVADSQGFFHFSHVAVRQGFDSFCLESIDFERIGNSEACIEFEPVQVSQDITDVFLPPTIGLFEKQISAGSQALIFGYSMPNAAVDVRIREGETFEIQADETGYYEHRYESVPAGKYFLSSVADYEELTSLEPKGGVELEALTLPEQVAQTTGDITRDVVRQAGDVATNTFWGFLLFVIPLIFIIALILLFILKPALFHTLLNKFKPNRALHDDWLLEFVSNYEK